mmetsp:Transcript_1025/g.3971  ORF Transcript_1025/g.3971 Transcript_1025/m.3971 type:complete len:650 (-) Transcript_1025:1231-3180(-)
MRRVLVHEQHSTRRGANENPGPRPGIEHQRLGVLLRGPGLGPVQIHERGDEERPRSASVDVPPEPLGERCRGMQRSGVHVEVPLEAVVLDRGVSHDRGDPVAPVVAVAGVVVAVPEQSAHRAGHALRLERVRGHEPHDVLRVQRAEPRQHGLHARRPRDGSQSGRAETPGVGGITIQNGSRSRVQSASRRTRIAGGSVRKRAHAVVRLPDPLPRRRPGRRQVRPARLGERLQQRGAQRFAHDAVQHDDGARVGSRRRLVFFFFFVVFAVRVVSVRVVSVGGFLRVGAPRRNLRARRSLRAARKGPTRRGGAAVVPVGASARPVRPRGGTGTVPVRRARGKRPRTRTPRPRSVFLAAVVVSSRPIGVASFRLSLGAFDILQKRARLSFGGFAFFTQRLRHERQREQTAFFLRGFLAILNRSKRLGFRARQTPALGDGVRQRTRGRFVVVVFVRSLRLRRLVALVAASPAADPDLALELLADPELLGDGLLRARQVRQALADRALRPAARVLVLQEHAFLRAQVLASAFGGIFTLQPLEGGVVVVAVDHRSVAVDHLHRARLAVVPVERLALDRLDPFRLELVPKKQIAHLRQTRAALARLLRAQSVQRQVLRALDVAPADQAALLDLRHDGLFEIRRAVTSSVERGVHRR